MSSVSITILDEELVEWINSIPKQGRADEIARTLRVGKMVVSFAKLSSDSDTLDDYFSPLVERMETLGSALDRIIQRSSQSEGRGRIGEQAALTQLQNANRSDQFHSVSSKHQNSDIEATFEVRGRPHTVLIEVKTYTSPVPSSEFKKFENDLKVQAKQYGFFVSLGQRIQGVTNRMKILESSESLVMALAGVDDNGLILGYDLFKHMVERHIFGSKLDTKSFGEEMWERINEDLDRLGTLDRMANDLETSARTSEEAARKTSVDVIRMRQKLADSLTAIRRSIHRIEDRKPVDLPNQTNIYSPPKELPPHPTASRPHPQLESPDTSNLNDWEKEALIKLKNAGLDIEKRDDGWNIFRFGLYTGKVVLSKTNPLAELAFANGVPGPLQKYEQLKQGGIIMVISGKYIDFIDRVLYRLNQK